VRKAKRKGFIEIAMASDVSALAEADPDFTVEDLQKLATEMRTVMTYWVASMTPEHRERMDQSIVSEFETDMQRDTALLSLRDYINKHAPKAQMGIEILADSPAINYQIEAKREPQIWMDVINAVTNESAYRLCSHCGKPFVYKSTKAMYCSSCTPGSWSMPRKNTSRPCAGKTST